MIMSEKLPPILRAMFMSHKRHLVDWTETRALEEKTSFQSSTTPQEQNYGPSSWGLLLGMKPMELQQNPKAMSMLQDIRRADWTGTRTQEAKTSLSSSTIPTGTSNNLHQPVSIISILSRRSRNVATGSSCWFPGLGSSRDSCHFRNSTADFPSSKCSSSINCSTLVHLIRIPSQR